MSRLGILRTHIEQVNTRVGTRSTLAGGLCWTAQWTVDTHRSALLSGGARRALGAGAPGQTDGAGGARGSALARRALQKHTQVKACTDSPGNFHEVVFMRQVREKLFMSPAGRRLRIHCVQVKKKG